jgi:L-aspartate oxidase
MLEVIVFSKRAVERAENENNGEERNSRQLPLIKHSLIKRKTDAQLPLLNISAVQKLMWEKVGIMREGESLTEAADCMAVWQALVSRPTDRHSHELFNMVLAGRLIIESALIREESRGAHFRTDFPQTRSDWQKHIVFFQQE